MYLQTVTHNAVIYLDIREVINAERISSDLQLQSAEGKIYIIRIGSHVFFVVTPYPMWSVWGGGQTMLVSVIGAGGTVSECWREKLFMMMVQGYTWDMN